MSGYLARAFQNLRTAAGPAIRRHKTAVIFWVLLVGAISALTAASDILRDWRADEAALSRTIFREALSGALVLVFIPVIVWFDGKMVRRALPVWMTAALHGAMASIFAILRPILLSIFYVLPDVIGGAQYNFGYIIQRSLQEFPKELIVYGLIVALLRLLPHLTLPAPPVKAPRLTLRDGAKLVSVDIDEIEQVSAARNYVEISTGAKTLLHRSTLAQLQRQLPTERFFRIQRSSIVNLDIVGSVDADGPRDYAVTLKSGKRVRIARNIRQALMKALQSR